jgi:DNA-binding winged helix-turn-helix (wHTH) protein/TolB-like protein
VIRFAGFEVDPDAGILRRDDARIKLQDLPFRLLVILLGRPGAVVTRDELRQALWGAETFVDAEAGLNTAIAKLREALGDAADAPRFIETLPKRGYRFIGTLEPAAVHSNVGRAGEPSNAGRAALRPAQGVPSESRDGLGRANRSVLLIVAMVVVGLTVAGYYFTASGPDPITMAVVRFHNETGDATHDRLAESLTDAVVVSLAGNPSYGVIGNSPLLRTNRLFQDVRKIAEALDAHYVVLGQLQNGDAGLVVRAHFIRVTDETHLWAGKIALADVTDDERAVTSMVLDGVAAGLNRQRRD